MKNISVLGFVALVFFVAKVSEMGMVDAKICNKIIPKEDCHFCTGACQKKFGPTASPRCGDNDECNCIYSC
ncbi:hypothetical protein SAY86_025762 [Trapa natans]|uniref:Uncharacterized protein n=1 Tax=Trapa natans TaxID=22666 RepID=A0AAN7QDV1_TRANT|nr:hypothetical protein SAY86_025762 [Trapa natans]